MTTNIENIENIVKMEATDFQEICNYIAKLEKKNKKLQHDFEEVCIHEEMLVRENKELKEELTYFKAKSLNLAEHCKKLASENYELSSEVKDLKFTRDFLTSPSETVPAGDDY